MHNFVRQKHIFCIIDEAEERKTYSTHRVRLLTSRKINISF